MKFLFYSPQMILEEIKKNQGSIQKRLGQNFLIDPNYVEKIFQTILEKIPEKELVLEIGPGLGALTHKLKEIYNLHCVEIDPILVKILKENYRDLLIFNLDILDFLDHQKENLYSFFVGNLPYYITTDILVKILLLRFRKPKRCIFLVQKEYAQKLLERNNSISIFVHNFAEVRKIFSVPKESFFPKPKVDSTLIELEFFLKEKSNPLILEKILRMSFRSKRKKLINSWNKGEKYIPFDLLLEFSNKIHLNTELRPEQIPKEKFYELANSISELIK